jgi:hypothetical protein
VTVGGLVAARYSAAPSIQEAGSSGSRVRDRGEVGSAGRPRCSRIFLAVAFSVMAASRRSRPAQCAQRRADVLQCPKCKGRMKLVAMVTDAKSVTRYLAGIGELADVPGRSPSRGPPYWKSVVLRRKALGDAA